MDDDSADLHPVGYCLKTQHPLEPPLSEYLSIVQVTRGGGDELSTWMDDDSADLHPVGYCLKTQHPLEPPLSEYLSIVQVTRGGRAVHMDGRRQRRPAPGGLLPQDAAPARAPAQ
ncbi:hypothetical protein O0L34_g6753 [Tuta absoluta]|nr:hypothetical protein O0L34_g6753 [Tuta absoluta]